MQVGAGVVGIRERRKLAQRLVAIERGGRGAQLDLEAIKYVAHHGQRSQTIHQEGEIAEVASRWRRTRSNVFREDERGFRQLVFAEGQTVLLLADNGRR